MIDFKQKERLVPSLIIVISLVVMAAATLFDRLAPVPGGGAVGHSHTITRRRMAKDVDLAKISGENARKALAPRIWQGNPEVVSAGVLALITKSSNQQLLKVGAFRPQRVQPLGTITELPYTVQISGAYPGIRAVMSSLDSKNSKIVLRSAQIASSEQGSNAVSATLGISAYLAADPSLIEKSAPSGSSAKTADKDTSNMKRGGTHG